MKWAVKRGRDVDFGASTRHAGPERTPTAVLIGPDDGALHLEVSLVDVPPGTTTDTRLFPFEESFFVLEGTATCRIGENVFNCRQNDFGFIPVGLHHGWNNPTDSPCRLLRVRAPQPRVLPGDAQKGIQRLSQVTGDGAPPDTDDPASRNVGHFETSTLPAPGPFQMKGFRSATATNVSIWMLVDEIIGAVHHTLFAVQFAPTDRSLTLGGQHYHPFEETYYILEGKATAHLEDEAYEVGPGDVVFAGVNTLHGFSNLGHDPVIWLEAQAPAPTHSDSAFFPSTWSQPGTSHD